MNHDSFECLWWQLNWNLRAFPDFALTFLWSIILPFKEVAFASTYGVIKALRPFQVYVVQYNKLSLGIEFQNATDESLVFFFSWRTAVLRLTMPCNWLEPKRTSPCRIISYGETNVKPGSHISSRYFKSCCTVLFQYLIQSCMVYICQKRNAADCFICRCVVFVDNDNTGCFVAFYGFSRVHLMVTDLNID